MWLIRDARNFAEYEIHLDGELVTAEVWEAGTGNELASEGWVWLLDPSGQPGEKLRGAVEIRRRAMETESDDVSATAVGIERTAAVNEWITCPGPHDTTLVGQVRSTDDDGGLAHWTEGPQELLGKQTRFSWLGATRIDPPAYAYRMPTGEEYSARNTGDGPYSPDPDRIVKLAPGLVSAFKHQPRTLFDADALAELAANIVDEGQKQPIRVRLAPAGSKRPYEVVSGERRLRACELAGIEVRAIVVEINDHDAIIEATAENFQREGLSVMDTARNIRLLIEQCHYTQAQAGKLMGHGQKWASQHVRLLDLPETVQGYLDRRLLDPSHGTALLPLLDLKDAQRVIDVADEAVRDQWSFRDVERRVSEIKQTEAEKAARQQATLLDDDTGSSGASSDPWRDAIAAALTWALRPNDMIWRTVQSAGQADAALATAIRHSIKTGRGSSPTTGATWLVDGGGNPTIWVSVSGRAEAGRGRGLKGDELVAAARNVLRIPQPGQKWEEPAVPEPPDHCDAATPTGPIEGVWTVGRYVRHQGNEIVARLARNVGSTLSPDVWDAEVVAGGRLQIPVGNFVTAAPDDYWELLPIGFNREQFQPTECQECGKSLAGELCSFVGGRKLCSGCTSAAREAEKVAPELGCAHCGGLFNGGATVEIRGYRYCRRPGCVEFTDSLTRAISGAVPPAPVADVQQSPPAAQPEAPIAPEEPANVPPVPPAPQKPGFLQTAIDKVQAKKPAATPAPAPPKPSAWEGKTQVVIGNELAERVLKCGYGPDAALVVFCELAEVVGEFEVRPVDGLDYLKQFLNACCDHEVDPAAAIAAIPTLAGASDAA